MEKILYIGPMRFEQSVANLTKDDYDLPETLDKDGICPTCKEVPKMGGKKYLECVICHTSLEEPETTACGIGHICYDCWDDLPEQVTE